MPLSEIAGILQKAGAHVEIRMDGAARAWIVAEKPPAS